MPVDKFILQGSASASRATIGSEASAMGSGTAIASGSATGAGAGTGAAKTVTKRERATIAAVKRMLSCVCKRAR